MSLVVPLLVVWLILIGYEMLGLEVKREALIITVAGLAVPLHILRIPAQSQGFAAQGISTNALILSYMAFMIAVFGWLFETLRNLADTGIVPSLWLLPAALLVVALACRVGFEVTRWDSSLRQGLRLLALMEGTALLMAGSTAMTNLGWPEYYVQAPLLIAVPFLYLVLSVVYPEDPLGQGSRWAGHALAIVLLSVGVFSLGSWFESNAREKGVYLLWAFLCAEAAGFYSLAAFLHRRPWLLLLVAALLCLSMALVFVHADLPEELIFPAVSMLAVSALAYLRYATGDQEEVRPELKRMASLSSAVLFMAAVGAGLMMWFRLFAADPTWLLIGATAAETVLVLCGAIIAADAGWRRVFGVTLVFLAGLTLVGVVQRADLTLGQQVELVLVCLGLLLLGIGHYAWYRETEREDPGATLALLFGSLLFGVPLAVATWVDRYNDHFLILNELGFLLGAVLMLVSGLMLRLKATTLVGGTLTALYFLTLLIFLPWSRMSYLAILMIVGGSVLFLLGLGLSVFRDRLRTLPEQIKRREGVFRVLDWR